MALHMNLMVNGQQVGYLVARRIAPVQPTSNDVCQYEWQLNINGENRSNLAGRPAEHRFGDGAWALVSRVIDAAGRGPRDTAPNSTEACPEETHSWRHFTAEQVDSYWIRCTLAVPHDEHKDENTGLTWVSQAEPVSGSSPSGGESS